MSARDRDREVQAELNRAAESVRDWQADGLAQGGACDFCAAILSDGFVTYRCAGAFVGGFSVLRDDLGTGTLEVGFDPLWAACPRCEPVVDRGDVGELVEHVLENRDPRVGPIAPEALAQTRADLTGIYENFFALRPEKLVRS